MIEEVEDGRDERREGGVGHPGIQAPADHETGDRGEHSGDVDALSVRRRRTGRCEVDVPQRSRPASDDGDRQRGIIRGMDRAMTAAGKNADAQARACDFSADLGRPQRQRRAAEKHPPIQDAEPRT